MQKTDFQSQVSSATKKKLVGMLGAPRGGQYRFLLEALSRLYPVEFRNVAGPDSEACDAFVVLDGPVAAGLAAAARGRPAYVVASDVPGANRAGDPEVRFGTSTCLEECLRGQVMSDRQVGETTALPVEAGDEILASRSGHAVWLNRPTAESSCQLAAVSPPPLTENEFLFQHLNGHRFLRLLPLMNFLRQLVKDVDWLSPPSQACFVIDDPSFYLPSYGFINYRRLAEHTRAHGYFVAIATIPIDSWWVNNSVAKTFRSGSPRLSVLIHGNNHTSRELLSEQNGATGLESAAQALRRVERLRQRHGIDVHKIMVAPHGAIAHGLLPNLLSLGYDAALVTTELLVKHNPQIRWPVLIGMGKSQVLGGGLPVIPRIRMSSDWKGDALLAAFHRQPVVIAGHHHDARHGLQMFEHIGRTIGSIKGVTWSDMRGILQANYLYRTTGDVLHVRLYSRSVTIPLPSGIRFICVERPWLEDGRKEHLVIQSSQGILNAGEWGLHTEPLPLGHFDAIEVSSRLARPLDCSTVPPPPASFWPIARKFFMEMRDRCAPAMFSMGWHGNWPGNPSA